MKIPDYNGGGGGGSSNGGYYNNGNYSDSYDSDPGDGYITPPNEDNSYSGPNHDEDFSEYMWMENEEEFDKQEMQRLEEEALMEQCIEAMLQDELEQQAAEAQEFEGSEPKSEAVESSKDLCNAFSNFHLARQQKVNVEKSTLNPLAAEFVPSVFSPSSP